MISDSKHLGGREPTRLSVAMAALLAAACATSRPPPAASKVQRSTVNGTSLAFVAEGSGPPVVIVHGAWGDLRSFSLAAPVLAFANTVIRVSLRLHWPNAWPASDTEAQEAYRDEVLAADLVAFIERLGRGPVVLVGHSFGCVVAAHAALARPDLVQRLVLVEPALYGLFPATPEGDRIRQESREWREELLAKLRAGQDPLTVTRSMYDEDRPGTFDAFPELRRQVLIDNARTMGPFLLSRQNAARFGCDEARRLAMPVLLIEGERTSDEMRAIASAALGCLPAAKRVVLAGAGHTIQWDAPEAMARAVARFSAE